VELTVGFGGHTFTKRQFHTLSSVIGRTKDGQFGTKRRRVARPELRLGILGNTIGLVYPIYPICLVGVVGILGLFGGRLGGC
jgi:hypothetical protein